MLDSHRACNYSENSTMMTIIIAVRRLKIPFLCMMRYEQHAYLSQVDPPSKFELTTKKTTRMQQHMSGETTELGEVVISAATSSIATSTVHTNKDAPCKNGGCKNWRSGRSGNESRSESPWHLLKTVFLISVIVAFFLWIIIYTLLDHYRIL
jgi:hypothetical protein